MKRLPIASSLLVVLLVGIGAAAWWPIYGETSFVVCAAGALAAGTALAVLGAVLRWAPHVVLLAGAGAWLLLGVPLAVPSQALWGVVPTGPGLIDLVVGTATGWRALLTIEPPVGDYQALLVPVFTLTLAASLVSVSLALRLRRPSPALAGPVVVLITGLAFGDGTAWAPIVLGGAFALVALSWLAARGGASRTRTGLAVAVVLAAIAAGVGVAAVVPVDDRAAARDVVPQPFDPNRLVSPLSAFRAMVTPPGSDEVELRVSSSLAGRLVATARMDDYDGVVYRVGSSTQTSDLFARVSATLGAETAGESAYTITVEGTADVWVPLAGAPSAIDFDDPEAGAVDPQDHLYYSHALETAAVSTGLDPGQTYRVRSTLLDEVADAEGLSPAGVGTAVSVAAAPTELAAFVADHADLDATPGERLTSLVDALRQGYVSHGADGEPFSRSGHGADRIAELLTAVPMLGDDEQYAVAAALLAQEVGFPARVAVGYRVPDADDGSADIAVTGADAVAWTEVLTADRGWVALDATPAPRPVPDDADEQQATSVQPPRVVPPQSADENVPPDATATQPTDRDQSGRDAMAELLLAIAGWTAVGLALVLVVLAPFLTVVAIKAVRRSRRRRAPPRRRAALAWSEVRDAAVDAHALPLDSRSIDGRTRTEVASLVGSAGAHDVAVLADRAQFAPEQPVEGDLDRLWTRAIQERHRLVGSRGRWGRIRAAISLRSLRTYHGKGGRRTSE